MKSREMRKTDKGQHCAGICHLPALKRLGCKESASLNTTPTRRASSLLTQESILRWSEAHGNVPALAINSIPRGQKKKKKTLSVAYTQCHCQCRFPDYIVWHLTWNGKENAKGKIFVGLLHV